MYSIKDYRILEKIYESATTLVFRGQRSLDSKPVVLKMSTGTHPSLRELSRYRHEYHILSSLDIDTVIAVDKLDEYENILLLIEEDFGGESLKKRLINHSFSIEEQLNIFISVATTLSQLHN